MRFLSIQRKQQTQFTDENSYAVIQAIRNV